MSYENWQIEKQRMMAGDESALDEYAAVADWCNESGQYTIIEDGEYYRVVKVEPDENEIAANME